ncbi:arp2/3 complex-activating protein rickA-like isoform X1 [Neodiprion fabricii]|uniref:arp2/3 complex-activating protein rickA-like isoform X1 n=1 Tax=Neodiprion fabricii TaxID=2872261 RepID=UPI001ED8DA0D|nr:arp2/3 complex-activating protein rickA-like isoform X1 [Neodiprion fabricii]
MKHTHSQYFWEFIRSIPVPRNKMNVTMDDQSNGESRSSLDVDRNVSLTDVFPFCNQLDKFIKYILSVRDLNFLTYEYPNILRNRLESSVSELQSILAEVKEAVANVEKLKAQRKSVRKEEITVKKILKRLRDDEIREMECTIALYDKPMFSRWESVKNSQKPEILEGILTDVKVNERNFRHLYNEHVNRGEHEGLKKRSLCHQNKQHALENLSVLVTRKLNQTQAFHPLSGVNEADKRPKEKTIIPLPFPSFCAPPLPPSRPPPPPPPLPPPLSAPGNVAPFVAPHLPKRSHAQRLSIQRRRRLERRDENLERRCVVAGNVEDLSLVPLTIGELPRCTLVSNLYPATLLRAASSSDHDILSPISGPSTAARNEVHEVTLLNNNVDNNGAGGLSFEFHNEMRTVLQALFGELRSAATLPTSDSTLGNAEDAENASDDMREIELYILRKNQ